MLAVGFTFIDGSDLTLVTNKRLLTIGDISVRVYQMVGHKYILRVAAILKAKGSTEEGRDGDNSSCWMRNDFLSGYLWDNIKGILLLHRRMGIACMCVCVETCVNIWRGPTGTRTRGITMWINELASCSCKHTKWGKLF